MELALWSAFGLCLINCGGGLLKPCQNMPLLAQKISVRKALQSQKLVRTHQIKDKNSSRHVSFTHTVLSSSTAPPPVKTSNFTAVKLQRTSPGQTLFIQLFSYHSEEKQQETPLYVVTARKQSAYLWTCYDWSTTSPWRVFV